MKKTVLSFLAFAAVSMSYAGEYVADAFDRIDIFRINKEAPSTFALTFTNLKDASAPIEIDDIANIYSSDSYKSLNGDWKFFFAQKPEEVKKDFFSKDFNDADWDSIDVPNSWQCRGYDRIFYNNMDMEFMYDFQGNQYPEFKDRKAFRDKYKMFIPKPHQQKAVYRRTFEVPQNWDGKDVFIKFSGVRTGFNLFVNGKFVGYSEDSFTPAEFNISKYIERNKSNSIAVEVFKYTTGSYYEMQDMPHMVGIIRDVTLIARPTLYVRDFYAPATLSPDFKSAKIDFSVELKNNSSSDFEGAKLVGYLFDADGNFKKALFAEQIKNIKSGEILTINAKSDFSDDLKLWSPDHPNLYTLVVELMNAKGETLEAVRTDYAFRKFEARGKELFLNGVPMLIKGTNRHDWSPDKGKAADFHWLKKDAELMKIANINAVRTSHYPNDDKFYMLCSRYGLAVLDECNNETHAFIKAPLLDKDEYVAPALDRMINMVMRDRNVPSVLMYSFGNESAFYRTKAHAALEAAARKLDPSRLYHSEAESHDIKDGRANGTMDFFSPMYGGVDKMNFYLNLKNETRPFFFCEYSHAMGNAIGNLKGKWELIRANHERGLNGGFIWDWVDQSVLLPRPEDKTKTYFSDGRDWGTMPSFNNFSCNGIILTDRNVTSKFYEVQKIYQDIQIDALDAPNGVLKISNEFFATNLDRFTPRVFVERDGEVIAEATLPTISLAAGKSAEVKIDLPKFDGSKFGEYFYTIKFFRKDTSAFAPKGSLAAQNQFLIKKLDAPAAQIKEGKIDLSQTADSIVVKAANVEVKFDKKNASLSGYFVNGTKVILSDSFDTDSALIDNFNRGLRAELGKNGFAKLTRKDASLSVEKRDDCVKITIVEKQISAKEQQGLSNTFVYSIFPNGSMKVDAKSQKIGGAPENIQFPRLGLRFLVNKDFDNVEYFGRGPLTNYSDRLYSANIGRYKSKVADWLENFTRSQDTGNREDVRWLELRNAKRLGVKISALGENLPISVLPYTQKELDSVKHLYQLPASSAIDLRVAWKTCGVGNASCGPNTRKQFMTYFKDSVEWSFLISPLQSAKAQN